MEHIVTYKGCVIAMEEIADNKVKVYVDKMLQITCNKALAEEAFLLVRQKIDSKQELNRKVKLHV